ncbi:MAG: M3 family oligoendopeptidase [Anaerolineales bacterium]|jgi:oligoendopeptidase F
MEARTTFEQTRWSLDDLFPAYDSPETKAAFDDFEARVTEFEGLRERLSSQISQADFMDFVYRYEYLNKLANRLYGFAGLWFAADTQDQQAQSFTAQIEQLLAEGENRILFFSLWWKNLAAEPAERLMDGAGPYRYWLEAMRQFKPHTLSEPEEKVINIKNITGVQALQRLYDTLTNRYVFKVEVDGEVQELTRGELMVYARHHDPELRARAYQELYRVYGDDGVVLGQIYQAIVRDWRNENVDLRHFANPISVRNLVNDIPDEVINTLLDVSEQNAGVFQDFFRLKARWLGVERLRRYDIYAPVAQSDKSYDYQAAADVVFESFQRFDPRFASLARRVFSDDHLDSEVRKGKRGGAFCWAVSNELSPWVLLNYQGRPEDVATMAHELGHAIHAMLAAHHPFLTFQSNLPLAETASTFGEMLLVDRLLEQEQDEAVRRDLLFRQVDDAYATIMRQIFFALFERTAHDMVKQGASVDELSEAYMENLKKQFGDAVDLSDEFRWEWVSIPHIYNTPFYVYAYAFGQLLVFALYRQFKQEGESFKPRYIDLLAAGGSDAPMRVLEAAGVDARKPEFWQGGFDVIKDLIRQLEALPLS